MTHRQSNENRRAFYVVQFIELPFEGIDDYVCVPDTWLTVPRPPDQKAVVAYPKDENPFDTRDRVKRKERSNEEWKLYKANVKYESDTYRDAEYWIATRNDYGPVNTSVMDTACQTDERMVEPLSPCYAVTSDSDTVTDHEKILDHDMSTHEDLVEPKNDVESTGITSGGSSADRPTAAETSRSLNHQLLPRVVLEQQMLDNFTTVFTQMGSTLRYTCDMYNDLRDSIHESAKTYRQLLDAVERFNTVGNSASNLSPTYNLPPEVPQVTDEIHIADTARASSSKENQHSHCVAHKAPKKKHKNLWRFVLPPEYDPHDTRWTLKYPQMMPGILELMPQSSIYVSYGAIKYCQQVSKDCKSLARRLLLEVFNRTALSVCSSMSEKAQDSYNVGSNVRPELDDHASTVLLNFVLEHGLQHGWNTDLKPILSTLHSKTQEIRFKYGVMVKC